MSRLESCRGKWTRTPVVAATMVILLAGLAAVDLEAQVSLKGGIAQATMTEAAPGFGSLGGVAAGLSLGFGIGPVSIRPELLYIQKTAARLADPDTPVGQGYLEVPVLLEWRTRAGGITLIGLAGGFVAVRPRCWADTCTDGISSKDYGVALGGGAQLGGAPSIGLEVRYDIGLERLYVDGGRSSRSRTLFVLAVLTL